MKSKRADGLGHWPAGKYRSTLTATERSRVIRRLHKQAETKSLRTIARTLEISDSSVRRILSGEDQPTERIRDLVVARLL